MLAQKEAELTGVGTSSLSYAQCPCLSDWLNAVQLRFCHRVHHVAELLDTVCRFLLLALRDHVSVEAWNHTHDVT